MTGKQLELKVKRTHKELTEQKELIYEDLCEIESAIQYLDEGICSSRLSDKMQDRLQKKLYELWDMVAQYKYDL